MRRESATDKDLRRCLEWHLRPSTARVDRAASGPGHYFRMKYISQLAAITDPTNSTQQYTPYFTMARGVDRCVIANTTEANVANSRTEVK